MKTNKVMKDTIKILLGLIMVGASFSAGAQTTLPDSTSKTYSLNECIAIALQNQPPKLQHIGPVGSGQRHVCVLLHEQY